VKKFTFPLDRVLAWRRTQARIEQTKLEKLQKELRGVEAQRTALAAEELQAQQAIVRSGASTGADLAALDLFRASCATQSKSLERNRETQAAKILAQQRVVALKERDVKLLEKLREQKLTTWRLENAKEIDTQAEESYLSRWSDM